MSKPNPAPTTPGRSRVLDWLLGVMCVVIICAGIVVLIAGFYAMVSTNARVERLLASATGSVIADEAISRFKDIGQGVLQANTIAFLFQVFSVGLIAACAYLVRRSWRQASETDEKLQDYARRVAAVTPFLGARVAALNVLNRITNVYNLAAVMAGAPSSKVIASVAPVARELMAQATELLGKAIEKRSGMAPVELAAIQDSAENADKRLKALATNTKLSQGSKGGLNHLIGRLEAFTALLKSRPFEEWYDQYTADL